MKYLLTVLSLFLLSFQASATRWYVSPSGTPTADGSSWTATTTLTSALSRVVAGDEVWVLQGTYLPADRPGRNASFRVPAGVRLLGGFAGHETTRVQRPASARSVLTGNLGDPASAKDNAFTVVTLLANRPAASTLDGFTITEGSARNFTTGFSHASAGGGLYVEAAPTFLPAHFVLNCSFVANKGHNGAGAYVAAGNTSFENCDFRDNVADFKGGGVYVQGAGTEANVRFHECTFESNGAKYGGALANNGENGVVHPLLVRCNFVLNVAKSNAAAIYNMTNETGECSVVTEQCLFDGNESILGDDIFTKGAKRSLADLQQSANESEVIISGAARR